MQEASAGWRLHRAPNGNVSNRPQAGSYLLKSNSHLERTEESLGGGAFEFRDEVVLRGGVLR